MNTQNLSTPQVFQSLSRKCKSHFLQRMHSKCAQRKLASHKKTSCGKVSRQSLVTIAKKNHLEAKKKRSVVRKGIATNNNHYTSRH